MVQHRSLPALTLALILFDQLMGLPGLEQREAARRRLLGMLPREPERWSLQLFAPLAHELFAPEKRQDER